MKHRMRVVGVTLAMCVVALVAAPRGLAQLGTLPPPLERAIINAYYPNVLDTPQGDSCGVICAEGFSLGSTVYISGLDMGLVGANYIGGNGSGVSPSAITCSFTVSIKLRNPDNSINFPGVSLLTLPETVTIPANNSSTQLSGQTVALPELSASVGLWLGPGDYYLMMDNTNGCTGANSASQGLLGWNLDAPSVAAVGPGFKHMIDFNAPATWLNIFGTYAFDLKGPIVLSPVGGGKFEKVRYVVEGPITPPAGGPVEAQVGFLNAETGTLLGPLQQVTLNPGQLESADLDLTPLVAQLGQRIEVQPVILQSPNAAGAVNSTPVQLSATVQVLDEFSGFQAVSAPMALPGETNVGTSQTGALGPQVLAAGQTMRFDVVATQNAPCVAQVSFNDGSDNALVPVVQVNLEPGTGTTVDLNSQTLGLRLGQNIEVQPVLTVAQPDAAVASNSVCNASVEVFDHLTGRTWSHQNTMLGLSAPPSSDGGTPGTPGVPSSAAGTQ